MEFVHRAEHAEVFQIHSEMSREEILQVCARLGENLTGLEFQAHNLYRSAR